MLLSFHLKGNERPQWRKSRIWVCCFLYSWGGI